MTAPVGDALSSAWFGPEDAAALADFWSVYDAHVDPKAFAESDSRDREVTEMTLTTFGDLVENAPALRDVLRRAIAGDWEPYEASLVGSVRGLIRTVLKRAGYRVLDASNGPEAIVVAERLAEPIHLLLTDVVMPGLSGREVADQLVAARPDLRVVYMSGYTDDAVVRHGILESTIEFLQKPITPDALMRKVRDVLDATAGARPE